MIQKKYDTKKIEKDEFSLIQIIRSLLPRIYLIASITGFVTILAIIYALNLSSSFKITTSFIKPSLSSVSIINTLNIPTENNESIFSKFLSNLDADKLKKDVFNNGNYLTKFNPNKVPIDDEDKFMLDIVKSVEIIEPPLIRKGFYNDAIREESWSLEMSGNNAANITTYLNQFISTASSKTITDLISFSKQSTANDIDTLTQQREALLKLAKENRLSQIKRIKEEDVQKIREINDQIDRVRYKARLVRLNQIEQIKEEDGQKIREINDQIDRVRYKAKENRLNKIAILNDNVKLAKSLGIIENNFKPFNSDETYSDLTISIGESKDYPEWYLYGAKALIERVELLEGRKSDDYSIPELITLRNQLNQIKNNNLLKTLETRQDDSYFIPELITLRNQLNQVKNNNLLKTLETRKDDSYFIPELNSLDIKKNQLESVLYNIDASPMRVLKSRIEVVQTSRRMIVLSAFFLSLIGSIFLALIMNAIKPD